MAQISFLDTQEFSIEKKITREPMPAMHHHPTIELFYIIKGEREYFVEDEFFLLREGDIILIPAGALHRTAGKSASRILLYFSTEFLEKYFTAETVNSLKIKQPLVFRPTEAGQNEMFSTLNALFSEYNRQIYVSDSIDGTLLAGYLYKILFALSHEKNTYVNEKYSDIRMERIVKYINENCAQVTDIEEIADYFYISKYHLCRLFKKNLGVGLITYLNTIKVRKACEVLNSGKHSITETATLCGFNSPSYFCKVFKAEMGISPTEYKKKKR